MGPVGALRGRSIGGIQRREVANWCLRRRKVRFRGLHTGRLVASGCSLIKYVQLGGRTVGDLSRIVKFFWRSYCWT